MRRALALLALAAAALLAALSVAAPDAPSRAEAALAARPVRAGNGADKPLPPLEVTLQAGAAVGPAVPVSFTIRPRIAMVSVRWEWDLSAGLSVTVGAAAGEARGERDAESGETTTLTVPSGGYGRATLRVSGTFLGSDAEGRVAPETVRVQQALTWGEPPPPVPEVLSTDAETGEPRPFAAVPVTWEPR